MYIYKITNNSNGKVYIGQTIQRFQKRFVDHIYEAFQTKRKSRLYSAMRKYGETAFTISLLEEILPPDGLDALNTAEARWIKHYNSIEDGYNLQPGGDSKRCHPETKIKISNALKGRKIENRWTGGNRAPRTDEQKAHLSKMIKGKPNVVLYKKVECIETGIIYESVNATASSMSVNRVTISALLKSGKKGRNGFSFRLV